MSFIHTTRVYTKTELEKGIDLDFPSNTKYLRGIQIIEATNNDVIYQEATIEVKIDRGQYLTAETPVSLLQSGVEVAPNQRFFTLAGKISSPSRKCNIKVLQPNTDKSLIFVFLLD